MKQILITILLSLILLPGYATNIDVKKAGTTHQGGARMPAATKLTADYEYGILTLNVFQYVGSVQVIIYNNGNMPVASLTTTSPGSDTITMNIDYLSDGDYTLYIFLGSAIYIGNFEI